MILYYGRISEFNTLQGRSYQGQVHCWGRRSDIEITKFEDRPLHVRRKWISKLRIGDCQPHEPGRSYADTDKYFVLNEYVYQIKLTERWQNGSTTWVGPE